MRNIKKTPRWLAMITLDRVIGQAAYSNLQLNNTIAHHQLSEVDKRLLTKIVYGTLQHKLTLDYRLAPFLNNKQLANWVHVLLLEAVYQLDYLERVPDFAVVNETVEIAKVHGNPGIRKLVTAVLHNYLRHPRRSLDEIKDPLLRLSVKRSVPRWLVGQLASDYGLAKTETILDSINEPAHLSLRVNQVKGNAAQAVDQLANDGVKVHRSPLAPAGLVVDSGNVIKSSAFNDGLVTIQDESAQLAVDSMNLSADFKVLDACAAPGGKTVQIAEQLDRGKVIALDLHANKVRLVQQNAARLGVSDRVTALALDARKVDECFADEQFDAILVDAPCSGIGLLRKKPEIRYDKTADDSQHLHQIQLAILDAVATKVKKGGIITYSTCTLLKTENELTVREFLSSHPQFAELTTQTTKCIKDGRDARSLTILPSDYGTDGFFIATIKRLS
ncbi:16S rRNA (cytosine(967)-C(5))-methyltransferase RsmB [uncultured Limosilactobacillus sp.]|uniref:16S rRNA (cytosine(967)-C(5))-methyltransferase RsmB n=1 Tax=uncultured Limosilactobacillus sp. TaxID=2837629 RepID=UPI0025E42B40|nr:16S rRNA (cytosine(967)-C(5))-methyltransferase RsmB [uncultured Limosilactobacillus sp.]